MRQPNAAPELLSRDAHWSYWRWTLGCGHPYHAKVDPTAIIATDELPAYIAIGRQQGGWGVTGFSESWLLDHQAKMAALRGLPAKAAPALIEFSLPFLLRLPNRTQGFHWSGGHAYRKLLLGPVAQALAPWQGHQPMERARISVTRHTTRLPDPGAAMASLKPLVDLFLVKSKVHPTGLGVLVDDTPDRLELIAESIQVHSNDQKRTTIRIEKL